MPAPRTGHGFLFGAALLVLSACQPSGGPTTAAGATPTADTSRAALFAQAAEARDACERHMPDRPATRAALVEAGFPTAYSAGGLTLHSPNTQNLIAAVSTASRKPACVVVIRRMSVAEAGQLIAPWLAAADAEPADPENPEVAQAWTGTFRGGPVELFILREFNEPGVIRGAAIVARAP